MFVNNHKFSDYVALALVSSFVGFLATAIFKDPLIILLFGVCWAFFVVIIYNIIPALRKKQRKEKEN